MRLDPATGLPVVGQGPAQSAMEEMQRRIKTRMPIHAISPAPGNITYIENETLHDTYVRSILQGMMANADLVNAYCETNEHGGVKFNTVKFVEQAFEITAAAIAYREPYFQMMEMAEAARATANKILEK